MGRTRTGFGLVVLVGALLAGNAGCDCVGYGSRRGEPECAPGECGDDTVPPTDPCEENPRAEGCPCDRGSAPWKCFDGPEGLGGIGQCKRGLRRCVEGFWSACEHQGFPEWETCNGEDDDCDGDVDEGLTNACGGCEGACTDTAGDPHAPRVTMDQEGRATLVWGRKDLTVAARIYEPGTGWGHAEVFDEGRYPVVATNDFGEVFALFRRWDVDGVSLWSARHSPAAGWVPAEIVAGPYILALETAVAVDPDGSALAHWRASSPESTHSYYRIREPHGGWGEIHAFDDWRHAAMVGEREGGFVVLGTRPLGDARVLWARRWVPDMGWEDETAVSVQGSERVGSAALGVDQSGTAVAIWQQRTREDALEHCGNRREAGSDWGEPDCTTFDFGGSWAVSVGADGVALVAWAVNGRTWATTFETSGWAHPRQVAETGSAGFAAARAGAERNVLAWTLGAGPFSRRVWTCASEDGMWGAATVMEESPLTAVATGPTIAAAPNGSWVVAWEHTEFDGQSSVVAVVATE